MSEDLKISYQDKELLCSGTFITFCKEQTVLEVKHKTDSIKLIFEFVTLPELKGPQTKTEVLVPSTLKITFANFNNPLGTYTIEPWEIGKSLNRTIYFLGDVVDLSTSKGMKKITYSIYLGPEMPNG